MLLQFFYDKKIFKFSSIIIIILGFISFISVFYKTIELENIHNLYYYNYTDSFDKAISIFKKEYVLNEHKKIDYDQLRKKYYPALEQAEKNHDERLYYKTMFEFAKSFKDGHILHHNNATTLEEMAERRSFLEDYNNRDYGFASVLLSDGSIVAILVDEDSEAYNKGLRDGMVITKKGDVNIDEVLNEVITPLNSYPVLEDERLINSFYLFASGDDQVRVSFLDDNNKEVTIDVHSTNNPPTKADELYYKIMLDNSELEHLDTKMLDNNTGYIYIKHERYDNFRGAIGYLHDDASYLTKIVDKKIQDLKNQGATNLVIDLRGNGGGLLVESESIASFFTNDNYLVLKGAKYDSNLYDESFLKGNGKYANMNPIVLVDANTVSAGDLLVYMFSKIPNAKIIGFTNSNNSAQSVGGVIILSGGTSLISYPIHKSHGADDKILIDTDATRIANVKLGERINLTRDNIKEIFYSPDGYDYLLNYAIKISE